MSNPIDGENVIKISNPMTVSWISKNVNEVTIHFIKNCQNQEMKEDIQIARYPSYDGKNSYTFYINESMFSEQYFLCQVIVESADDLEVLSYSQTFKVVREG